MLLIIMFSTGRRKLHIYPIVAANLAIPEYISSVLTVFFIHLYTSLNISGNAAISSGEAISRRGIITKSR